MKYFITTLLVFFITSTAMADRTYSCSNKSAALGDSKASVLRNFKGSIVSQGHIKNITRTTGRYIRGRYKEYSVTNTVEEIIISCDWYGNTSYHSLTFEADRLVGIDRVE